MSDFELLYLVVIVAIFFGRLGYLIGGWIIDRVCSPNTTCLRITRINKEVK